MNETLTLVTLAITLVILALISVLLQRRRWSATETVKKTVIIFVIIGVVWMLAGFIAAVARTEELSPVFYIGVAFFLIGIIRLGMEKFKPAKQPRARKPAKRKPRKRKR
jgi:uncharacterized membrane protein YoaK (UPF0700 family)